MLDLKFIRDNIDAVKKGAQDKKIHLDLDSLLAVDAKLKPLQQELESLQSQRNALSKSIGALPATERDAAKNQVASIKTKMETTQKEIDQLRPELERLLLLVPQPARADVPIGKDDTENVEVRKVGTPPQFAFEPLDHAAIGEKLGIIDTARGVKLAGSRSYILRGDAARLEQAVLRYTYDKLCAKGYVPMSIPVLVKEDAMVGTGYFPTGRDQAYLVERDEMTLVGTAEVSLTSYFGDEILSMRDLPFRMMAWSPCFRREAGTYGKDTRGLYRVHQFQKIEQVIIAPADPALSEKLHDELLTNAEEILQDFELPYRVVYVCTGDLGQGQVRKHDIETWMPSRKAYSETHSCSTFHDFQARRLKMRYKDEQGKTQVCYTLNNTAIASPRVLIPLLECHQQADGSVRIPEKLRRYMDGQKTLRPS